MPNNSLFTLSLAPKRKLCVLGAAVVDIVANTPYLPSSGADLGIEEKGIHIGGCALNIAVAIANLGFSSINAIPIGSGKWASFIQEAMQKKGIQSHFTNLSQDNGWCLALVEPNGERTFLSVTGVENRFDRQMLSTLCLDDDAIIYISGYQLIAKCGAEIIDWLETLPKTINIFVDFGPRIADIDSAIFARLLAIKPFVSLNRQEAEYLGMQETNAFIQHWHKKYDCPLIVRLDSQGACYHDGNSARHVPAFSTHVVDTIGAGDAHAAGVLMGLSSGWALFDAVLLANALAAYVVGHQGADCSPNLSKLKAFLDSHAQSLLEPI